MAVTDFVDGGGDIPYPLTAALDMAQPTFSGLKLQFNFVAGGYYDQPLQDCEQARAAFNVFRALQSYKGRGELSTPEWEEKNPGFADIYRYVLGLRGAA